MLITASEQQPFSRLAQIVDDSTTVSHKWFSLQDNKLDGSYHPIDSAGAENLGWWGTSLSDASNAFAIPPSIEIIPDVVESIALLVVAGDPQLNEYPVDFDIDLYDSLDALILHKEVRGNSGVIWKDTVGQYYETTRMVVTVLKVNKPYRSVKLIEAYTTEEIININRADQFAVSLVDIIPLTEVAVSDDVLIRHNVEAVDILAELWSTDALSLNAEEDKDLTNIHTVLSAPKRQVHGKVEIMYTDPFKVQQIVPTADSTARGTYPAQTADNIGSPKAKWFALHDNRLDGTYKPLSGTGNAQVGWWADVLSDGQGNVDPAPTLTVTLLPRTFDTLKVTGDNVADIFPTDFIIKLYDESDTLLYTHTVTDNALAKWSADIEAIDDCAKFTLTVSKVNKPYSSVRVLEFVTSVTKTYTDEDGLIMFQLLEEREISDGSLPIGNITANEIDVRLDNTDKQFTTGNDQSSVSELLKPNRRIQAWLGAEVVPDVIEWYSLGTFWSTSWRAEEGEIHAEVVGRDILHRLGQTDYTNGTVQTDVTLKQLAEEVLIDAGLTASEFYVDPVLATHVIPNAWIGRMSHREALRLIAEAGLAVAYVNRDGVVTLTRGTIAENHMVEFSKERDTFNIQNPQDWSTVVNFVEAEWQPLELDIAQQVHNSTGISEPIAPGETVELTLAFTQTPVKTVSDVAITGGANITITNQQHFAWGSVIAATNNGVTEETLQSIIITGQPMKSSTFVQTAKDDNLIRDNGKLPYKFSNPLVQSRTLANTIASTLLTNFKDPQRTFILATRGNIALRLGDRVRLPIFGGTQDATLVRQRLIYDGALESTVDVLKIQ